MSRGKQAVGGGPRPPRPRIGCERSRSLGYAADVLAREATALLARGQPGAQALADVVGWMRSWRAWHRSGCRRCSKVAPAPERQREQAEALTFPPCPVTAAQAGTTLRVPCDYVAGHEGPHGNNALGVSWR